MRKEIKARMTARKKELEHIKADLTFFLKAAFYEKVPAGRYEGMYGVEALPLLVRDAAFGITGLSKQQISTILRLLDQFVGRGEVAAEAKDIAAESGPKVLYVGGERKPAPTTIQAEVIPALQEGQNVG